MDFAGSVLLIELVHLVVFACLKRRALCRLLSAEQQLRVHKRQVRRPTLKDRDRMFWVHLSKLWKGWREHLAVVQPRAALQWQRHRARDWWRRKSRRGPGWPPIRKAHIDLIKRMANDDPSIGEDTIALELEKEFGVQHSPTTISKVMREARRGGHGGR